MALALFVFAGIINIGAPIATLVMLLNLPGFIGYMRSGGSSDIDQEENRNLFLGSAVTAVVLWGTLLSIVLWGSSEWRALIFLIPQ